MEDQLRFESIMKEINVKSAQLQLYRPLSSVSSVGWDSVGSSSILGYMED